MSSDLQEITVEGVVSRTENEYSITTSDGTKYNLSAIMPWEAVAPGYGTGVFTHYIGKQTIASGLNDGHTIWNAQLTEVTQSQS